MTNAFERFWSLGYTSLVPIVPPDAPVSPRSTLAKRVGTRQDGRGKTPGVRGAQGDWFSFDWLQHATTEDDLPRWHRMGAGVGIRTGNGLLAIDADTLDEASARTIKQTIDAMIGPTPVRVGNYPKALYVVQCAEPYRYSRVEFGEINERGYRNDRVEILSDGRQFVAGGVHPKTGKPYTWPRPIVSRDELPTVTPQQLDDLLNRLRELLPHANEKIIREGANSDVNQAALKGEQRAVVAAVHAMPNTSEYFPTREHFVQIGYAIKASLPDDPQTAFDLYADWASRWEDDTNDPDLVAAEWSRMKPPYKIGAGWLYEQAERTSQGKFRTVDAWFEPIPDQPENPFAQVRMSEEQNRPDPIADMASGIRIAPYEVPDPTTIPAREWIYSNQYIRKFASATIAPTAVGKSSLGIVEALAMASGKPLLGIEPKGRFKVWIWNGEDPMDELDRRVSAAMKHYGLSQNDIGDRLFLSSGRNMGITVAVETKDGARILEPVMGAIETALLGNGVDVMIVDPFVSSHRVSENDNNAIDMVAKRWGKVADHCRCAIELVHHSRKLNGGVTSVEDSRGAGALMNAVRPARAIMKMQREEAATLGVDEPWRYFRFADAKNNLAPPAVSGEDVWMRMVSVDLGNGDSVGVVCPAATIRAAGILVGGEVDGALALIGGAAWRHDARSGSRWVGIPIAAAADLDPEQPSDRKRIKELISEWIKDGTLILFEDKDYNRQVRTFVKLSEDALAKRHAQEHTARITDGLSLFD